MRIGPLGIWELLIILVVVLLIFGPRRLPEMAKGIGQSVREFRKGIKDMKNDFEEGTAPDEERSKEQKRAPATVAASTAAGGSTGTTAGTAADASEATSSEAASRDAENDSERAKVPADA